MDLRLNAQEQELLSALNQCQARYLVIGGHAVIFHGYLRPAKDLDIWVEPTEENANRVARALSLVRVFLEREQVTRLASPDLQMPISGLNTEFLTSVAGLEFASAMTRSAVSFEGGEPCNVLGLADLIVCKERLGRESDVEDIKHLQEIHPRGA